MRPLCVCVCVRPRGEKNPSNLGQETIDDSLSLSLADSILPSRLSAVVVVAASEESERCAIAISRRRNNNTIGARPGLGILC